VWLLFSNFINGDRRSRSRRGTISHHDAQLGLSDKKQITGANGTIGYASVLHALRTGYRVRCIVRRDEAISQIKRGPSVQQFLDRMEYAIVLDNTIPGAYDDALKGAQHVVHIAGVWPKPVSTFLDCHQSEPTTAARTRAELSSLEQELSLA
jgi:hypothetical protein